MRLWVCKYKPCLSHTSSIFFFLSEQLTLMLVSITTKQATDTFSVVYWDSRPFLFGLYFKNIFPFYFLSLGFSLACMTSCVQCLQRPEEADSSPGTGVLDDCEPSCWCWESNWSVEEPTPLPIMSQLSVPTAHVQKVSWALGPVWPDVHTFRFLRTLSMVLFSGTLPTNPIFNTFKQ